MGGDANADFSLAWETYTNGDFDGAQRIVKIHLNSKLTSKQQQANFYYMEALIFSKLKAGEERAERAFVKARTLYEGMGLDHDVFNTNLGLSRLQIQRGHLSAAEATLLDAVALGEVVGYPLGYPYLLLAKIAFEDENFALAAEMSAESLAAFEMAGNERGVVDAKLGLGFHLMLSGDLESGLRLTLEAQSGNIDLGDKNKFAYGLINQMLHARKSGMSTDTYEELIQRSMDQENDQDLKFLFEFVLGQEPQQASDWESDSSNETDIQLIDGVIHYSNGSKSPTANNGNKSTTANARGGEGEPPPPTPADSTGQTHGGSSDSPPS